MASNTTESISDQFVDVSDALYVAERLASILQGLVQETFSPKFRHPPQLGSGYVYTLNETSSEDIEFLSGELFSAVFEARAKFRTAAQQ